MRKALLLLSLLFSLYACDAQESDSISTAFDPMEATVVDLQRGLDSADFTVREVVETYLQRIEALNKKGPQLNAVLSVNPAALRIADSLDLLLSRGQKLGPLHGIPIILKDNIETLDSMPTTAGSRALAENFVKRDAPLVARLRAAGAIILAKANLSEWANFRGENSISGWSGLGGFTRNPYVLSRNPCGSSSGSAVVVAAGLAPVAIGTETNGSIICPSQTNGIVGIKPTVGMVPGEGIIPIAWSQDVAGPMAKTVEDALIVLEVIADPDPHNPARLKNWPPQNWQARPSLPALIPEKPLLGKRIGVFTNAQGKDAQVDSLFKKAQSELEALGASLVEVPEILATGTNYASYRVMLYEYQVGLNRYLRSLDSQAYAHSIPELIEFNKSDSLELRWFGQEYLELAAGIDSTDLKSYRYNLQMMQVNSREKGIDLIMDSLKLDLFIAPSGSPAWMIDPINGDHYILSSASPAAISGYPNLSLPMGMVEGLPVGMSLFGRALEEQKLIEVALIYEKFRARISPPQFLNEDPALKN
jgi:amidase